MAASIAPVVIDLPRLNQYIFNPLVAIRRVLTRRFTTDPDPLRVEDIGLPWKQTIGVFTEESIGRSIAVTGVFDPCLTETVHRLLDPGGACVDVGANVGYVSSLMGTRIGAHGTVFAFEPHPAIFELLERNASRWNRDPETATVQTDRVALSNKAGTGRLSTGSKFAENMGIAAIRDDRATPGAADDFDVELARLDDLIPDDEIQLLKIDVEGHELAVLEGAPNLLSSGRLRDLIFEDHGAYPTGPMTCLEQHGMQVFKLEHSLLGPRLRPAAEGGALPDWPGPNYLATVDPDRAVQRLAPRGWRSLGLGHRRFRAGGDR